VPAGSAEIVKRAFDEAAFDWYTFYEGPFRRRLEIFRRAISTCDRGRGLWLDAGCGSGVFIEHLRAHGVLACGVDFAPAMIEAARERTGLRVVSGSSEAQAVGASLAVADVADLPYPDDRFDGAYACAVLEYVTDVEAAFRELARVVRPGGHVIFTHDNNRSLPYVVGRVWHGLRGALRGEPDVPPLPRNDLPNRVYRHLLAVTGWAVQWCEFHDIPRTVGERSPWLGRIALVCACRQPFPAW
jgi:SAM-dependent methyltransferase